MSTKPLALEDALTQALATVDSLQRKIRELRKELEIERDNVCDYAAKIRELEERLERNASGA